MRALMRCAAGLSAAAMLGGCTLTAPLEPPKLSIVNVQLLSGDLLTQQLRARVHVQNPNDRPLAVKGLEYTIEVEGEQFAGGETAASFVVPARGEGV